jgi:PKD repeat protein
MHGLRRSRRLMIVAGLVLAVFGGPLAAVASPPENDFFVNAMEMSSLPFTDSGSLAGTTTEDGEFQFYNCSPMQQTVWYRLPASATPVVLTANINGSEPGLLFNVWQTYGGGLNSLGFQGCAFVGGSVQFTTQPGATYYIQAGSTSFGSAHLVVNVQQVPPPANDDFANATVIDSRPFLDFADLTPATVEAGEPTLPSGAFTSIVASVWYAYTPDSDESLSATANTCCVTPILAIYTGSSVQGLTQVAGGSGFGPVSFMAVAGTTYYFQLGRGSIIGGSAPLSFQLAPTPPPVASFFFYPSDPSIYDTVQFQDVSYDPGQIGFASQAWELGDGTSASGSFPSHHYGADGDYTVGLAVTTHDGRSASTSQVVRVRTHDIAITKFTVPTSAKAGQTRELTVGVRNSLYPESVQFQLFKSVPGFGGFQPVGTLTQLIPVRPGNKTVPVTFSYTFSNDDAAVGKVTFQVIATIMGGRDAISADNTAIAAPTRVNP